MATQTQNRVQNTRFERQTIELLVDTRTSALAPRVNCFDSGDSRSIYSLEHRAVILCCPMSMPVKGFAIASPRRKINLN